MLRANRNLLNSVYSPFKNSYFTGTEMMIKEGIVIILERNLRIHVLLLLIDNHHFIKQLNCLKKWTFISVFSIFLKFILLNKDLKHPVPPLPPLPPLPHPKGDIGSQNGTRDTGKTSRHHSVDLRASQPTDVRTNQERWLSLKEEGKGFGINIIIISVICLMFIVQTVVYLSQEDIPSCSHRFCWRRRHGNLHYESNLWRRKKITEKDVTEP